MEQGIKYSIALDYEKLRRINNDYLTGDSTLEAMFERGLPTLAVQTCIFLSGRGYNVAGNLNRNFQVSRKITPEDISEIESQSEGIGFPLKIELGSATDRYLKEHFLHPSSIGQNTRFNSLTSKQNIII